MPKRCYILGAGFSKPFGLPLARELTKDVIEHYISNANGALEASLYWAMTQWKPFLKKLYPCCDFASTWPDFEDLITVLDEWEDYRFDIHGTPTPPDLMQPAYVKKVLLKHLAQLFCKKTPAEDNKEFEPAMQFVQKCATSESSVISFNWDVLLEAAAQDEDIRCSYGEDDGEAGLLLAKPHGSINVADIASDLNDDLYSPRKELLKYGSRVVVCANDPRRAKEDVVDPFGVKRDPSREGSGQAGETPGSQSVQDSGGALLVAPTAKKSYEHPWLIKQWQRAYDFILSAEDIVVIGFSLPSTDYRPRVLLQTAGFHRRTRTRRLILVSPHACDVAKRYREFVSLPIECRNSDWREWMEEES